MTDTTPNTTTIKDHVRQRYGELAEQQAGCCTPAPASAALEFTDERSAVASCCGPGQATADLSYADRFYDPNQIGDLPNSVTDLSLGCGNPTAFASLKPGQTVLDLGSGGGIDCFIAARAVGPGGHVIGVDMTPQMLELANRNKAKLGLSNVEFRRGEIEALPVADETVDVIVSNCVINLSPDKEAVFREAYRVLKPNGRLVVSDMVTRGTWPQGLRDNSDAWASCLSGAEDEEVYLDLIRHSGFADVQVDSRSSRGSDPAALLDFVSDEERARLQQQDTLSLLPPDFKVLSIQVTAYK
jgi:arsenite methyltransferase